MISFDTSSTATGWAYWENGMLIDSGVLDHKKEKNTDIRIEDMCIDIIKTLNSFKPSIVVVEEQAFARSVAVAVMNAKIIGVILGWCLTIGYGEFVTLRPSKWRKLVAGKDTVPTDRKAAKKWDIQKAEEFAHYKVADDNEADSILVGLARIKEFEDSEIA